ncbi:hypothetical protein [Aliamphritea spongicola]|nr:hypothetical protein [Aliamphritea spongicola]
MLQVYDRVVTSGSLSTLLMLTLIMVALLLAMGCLEWCRSKILIRAGARFDRLLAAKTFDVGFKQSLYSGAAITPLAVFRTSTGYVVLCPVTHCLHSSMPLDARLYRCDVYIPSFVWLGSGVQRDSAGGAGCH